MNLIDILILLFSFIIIYHGYNIGFIKQYSSFISYILYIFLYIKIFIINYNYLPIFHKIQIFNILYFIISCIITMIIILLIKFFIKNIYKIIIVNYIDNILGSLFAFIKLYLYISIIIYIIYNNNIYLNFLPFKMLNNSIFYQEILNINYKILYLYI